MFDHFARAARGLLPLTAVLAMALPAFAQSGIGSATSIERDVSGTLGGRTRAVAIGDNVFGNETIRTANASAASLRFLDETRIAIGPAASVVLDRFVYNPDRTARAAALRVTQGALRWTSGASNKNAYEVRTPYAVIGVRGTTFDLLVNSERMDVTLHDGEIRVCPIATPRRCITMFPGQTLTVTRRGASSPRQNGPSPTDFADRCLRAIDRAACTMTASAEPVFTPPPQWTGFYIGLHGGVGRQETDVRIDGSASIVASIGAGNVPDALSRSGAGGLIGAQAGYNFQVGSIVFGAETDFAFTNLGRRATVARNPFVTPVVTTSADDDLLYIGTVRGRLGFAFDNLLIFGTGGLAYGGVEQSGYIRPVPTNNPTYEGSRTSVAVGWALGGGFEYAFTRQISVKVDYLHYDLGSRTMTLRETTGALPTEFATYRSKVRGDLMRAGFNYRF